MAKAVEHLFSWYEENKALFSPPVCNKLMHREQLSVMFVGGPNQREDFHIDEGSEFFWMVRGNMELPTIQNGKRKVVRIREGQVFLLPSRVQHSPQRPETGSLGLVVERRRDEGELDGLRYFRDFQKCERVLWERYFQCFDLGRDLVPVVKAFHASEEKVTRVPGSDVSAVPPVDIDTTTEVPEPFYLRPWIDARRAELDAGAELSLFGDAHPDKEFRVSIVGGGSDAWRRPPSVRGMESWVYVHEGEVEVTVDGTEGSTKLTKDMCCIVPAGVGWGMARGSKSVTMVVTNDPAGNKPRRGTMGAIRMQAAKEGRKVDNTTVAFTLGFVAGRKAAAMAAGK
jgi:3-hydroxyanthranilate 3,4-dioxygenase